MRRREFVLGLGNAAAWPLAARAQQAALPVVGYLYPGDPEVSTQYVASFRKGLSEAGFIEGRDVTVEYRFARDEFDRLPALAADLVRRRVTVIAAHTLRAALAAKAATSTIPIVFRIAADPVQYGLVASLNRPVGNLTGLNDLGVGLNAKRLGLLHELLPRASRLALLLDPTTPTAEAETTDIRAAAAAMGRPIEVVTASTNREIDIAFVTLVQKRIDALLVAFDVLFSTRRVQLVTLTNYHRLPAIYGLRDTVEVGGLIGGAGELLPAHECTLAASFERLEPTPSHLVEVPPQARAVSGNGIVVQIPFEHPIQPCSSLGNGVVHSFAQLHLDLLQLLQHPLLDRLAPDNERAPFA